MTSNREDEASSSMRVAEAGGPEARNQQSSAHERVGVYFEINRELEDV